MSAFATLTLQNNAATDVVFNPANIENGIAYWYTTASVYDAAWKTQMSVRRPLKGSQVSRIKQRVVIPHMDPVDTTKKIGESYVDVEFVLHKQSTQTNRLDLRKMIDTLLTNAVTTAAVDGLEAIY